MKFKIKTAPYNPRKFSKESRSALKKSMEEFSDISGITINSKTGNIVSGNHRWEELEKKHGKLSLFPVKDLDDRFAICDEDENFTGFMARVVDWSLTKEKQANIMANSTNATGDWSSGLQDVLKDINNDTEKALMEELRISEMLIDLTVSDDDLDLSKDTKRDKTLKANEDDEDFELGDDDEKTKNSEVREIISTIKITLPAEYKEEVMDAILKIVSKKPYYEEVKIYE